MNRNGFLTRNELAGDATVQRSFATIDSNGDGKISREEWSAWSDKSMEQKKMTDDDSSMKH